MVISQNLRIPSAFTLYINMRCCNCNAHLLSEVLEVCAILISILQWAMHFFIWFRVIVSGDTFCLNIVEEVHRKMFLREIPRLVNQV